MATHVAMLTVGLDADNYENAKAEAERIAALIGVRIPDSGVTFVTVDHVQEADHGAAQ